MEIAVGLIENGHPIFDASRISGPKNAKEDLSLVVE
jgi:hypothetical protein